MNPVYDNSVPFYPTIPNQNPTNAFFPNQNQHNGQYSRDSYGPYVPNAGYSNPPPLNVSYPPGFGYNSNRSVFFAPPNQRSVYRNLGINASVATMYPGNHNVVNPAYYPSSCGCANHNPVNTRHVPPYSRFVHVGDFIYQLPNSTQFNPPNANWHRNQNNVYYPPANQLPGNSTNTNWNYHHNLNQNPPSYTQPGQNLSYPPSQNYHAASGIPYSNQNTFQPIPGAYNDSLSDFSFDPLSSPSELNLLGSTPDLPTFNHDCASPNAEVCGNHTDINHNSANVINIQENQRADATVPSVEQPICSDVQEEPIPASSLTQSNIAAEDQMICDGQGTNSDQEKGDSTITAGQGSNNITSTPVSTVDTTIAQNDAETVLESNIALNNGANPSVVNVDIQNVEASEQDQTLDDNIPRAEKNSENVQNAIESKADELTLKTTTSSANLLSSMNTTANQKETTANLDPTSQNVNDGPTIVNADEFQHLTNNSDNPNTNSQPKPEVVQESLDSSTAKPDCKKFSPNCAADDAIWPRQISANFRRLLVRYLNRLDNVNITTDPNTSYGNIDDDIINSFVASLNAENRRLLQQNPNIGMENPPEVTKNVYNEKQENVGNIEKKEADQKVDTEVELKHNEENVSKENKEADQNIDTEPEPKEYKKCDQTTAKNEADQVADTEPEAEQCNVLLESCADHEEIPVNNEDDSTEPLQHLNEYQSADDLDVINANLDTIEVTIGDACYNSIEDEFLEDVPLDLAKEKKIPEPETGAKSQYFEVSQFLPKGNLYWQYFDTPSLQDNTTVYASYANDTDEHSLDVLVEVPLNLTSKNQSKPVESQTEDIGSKYPELSLLLSPQAIQSSLNNGAKATNGVATKRKEYSLMDRIIFVTKHSSDSSGPPMKKMRGNSGDPKTLVNNDEPKM